jgi:hypothetical protein
MPEPTKISLSEWWQYEKSVFFKACHETSRASIGRGFVVSVLALIGQGAAGLRNSHDTLLMVLISLGAGVLVFGVEFLFKLLRAPAKMAKEVKSCLESQKTDFDNEKKRLENTIESLRKPSVPTLEIEIIHPADLDILTSRRTYRIKVKNTHLSKVIKNTKVYLSEIKWPESVEKPMILSGIIFPHQLPEKGNQNNLLAHDLAGKSEKEFDLMFVSTPKFWRRIINLAPFRPKNIGTPSQFKSVDSDTSFDIEHLPKDDSKLVFTFKVIGGDGDVDTVTESYILKVPPLLPETSDENAVQNLNSLCQNLDKFMPTFENKG